MAHARPSHFKDPSRYKETKYDLSVELKDTSQSAKAGTLDVVHKKAGADDDAQKPKHTKSRFRKKISAAQDAAQVERSVGLQVMSGGLRRLLLEEHPKVRGTLADAQGNRYVITDAVPLSPQHNLFTDSTADLVRFLTAVANGQLQGLGGILVASLLTKNADPRPANTVPSATGLLVDVDNDSSGFNILLHFPFPITPALIAAFPELPPDFETHNWVGVRFKGQTLEGYQALQDSSIDPSNFKVTDAQLAEIKALLKKIASDPIFLNGRNGANPVFLKTLLTPNGLIETLFHSCTDTPVDAHNAAKCSQAQRAALRHHKLHQPSFRTYLLSASAATDLEKFMAHLQTLTTQGKQLLLSQHAATVGLSNADYLEKIREDFQQLRTAAAAIELNPAAVIPATPIDELERKIIGDQILKQVCEYQDLLELNEHQGFDAAKIKEEWFDLFADPAEVQRILSIYQEFLEDCLSLSGTRVPESMDWGSFAFGKLLSTDRKTFAEIGASWRQYASAIPASRADAGADASEPSEIAKEGQGTAYLLGALHADIGKLLEVSEETAASVRSTPELPSSSGTPSPRHDIHTPSSDDEANANASRFIP